MELVKNARYGTGIFTMLLEFNFLVSSIYVRITWE